MGIRNRERVYHVQYIARSPQIVEAALMHYSRSSTFDTYMDPAAALFGVQHWNVYNGVVNRTANMCECFHSPL